MKYCISSVCHNSLLLLLWLKVSLQQGCQLACTFETLVTETWNLKLITDT